MHAKRGKTATLDEVLGDWIRSHRLVIKLLTYFAEM